MATMAGVGAGPGQSWELGISFWIHMGGGSTSPGSSPAAFPGALVGCWIRSGAAGTQTRALI